MDLYWLLKKINIYIFIELGVEIQEQTQQSLYLRCIDFYSFQKKRKKKAAKQNTIALPSIWHGLNEMSYIMVTAMHILLYKKRIQPGPLPCD